MTHDEVPFNPVAEFDRTPASPSRLALDDARKYLAGLEKIYQSYPNPKGKETTLPRSEEHKKALQRVAQLQEIYDTQQKEFDDFVRTREAARSLNQTEIAEAVARDDENVLADALLSEIDDQKPQEILAMTPEQYVDQNFATIMDIVSRLKDESERRGALQGINRYNIPDKLIIPAFEEFCRKYIEDCGVDLTQEMESLAFEAVNKVTGERKWGLKEVDEKEDRQEDKGYINRAGMVTLDGQPILDYTASTGVWDEGDNPGEGQHNFVEDEGHDYIEIHFNTDFLKKSLTSALEYIQGVIQKS